ncbi:MAG TPA: M42 family peptidase, partial [Gemmatimonadales bacterium]|nr:M42 family peptidase [Gemmatimonadales bacterium]
MRPESLAFLKELLDLPGPSAFERAPARRWRDEAGKLGAEVGADATGNSWATLKGGDKQHVVLAGHMDEIGIMISYVDEQGFLSFDTIGG